MRLKTTVRLLVAVCVLGAFIWLLEHSRNPEEDRIAFDKLTDIDPAQVNHLLIESRGMLVDCVRKEGQWFINLPFRAKADESRIARILGVIETLKKNEVITDLQLEERKLNSEDYGLASPEGRIVLDQQFKRSEIIIGAKASYGDQVYVKLATYPDVIATSRDILDILPAKATDLRNRNVTGGDLHQAARIEIKSPAGFVQLEKVGEIWLIQQPVKARADLARVNSLLATLLSLKAERFIWDPPVYTGGQSSDLPVEEAGHPSLTSYGLEDDEALLKASVWFAGDDTATELAMGRRSADAADEVYAVKMGADSIFTVRKELITLLSVKVDELRDKSIFTTPPASMTGICLETKDRKLTLGRKGMQQWYITEPIQAKADDARVEAMLKSLSGISILSFIDGVDSVQARYGLDEQQLTIRTATNFSFRKDGPGTVQAAPVNWRTLHVGRPSESGDNIFMFSVEDRMVYEIPRQWAAVVSDVKVDPLHYMDRTVLSIMPDTVWRISLQSAGVRQTVELNEKNQWTVIEPAATNAAAPAEWAADTGRIEDLLIMMTGLKALRIESTGTMNPVPYGLEPPQMTLTISQKGGEGINKTLMTGYKALTDGIYATIKGQDLLFVLDRNIIADLQKGFLKAGLRNDTGARTEAAE